MSETDGGQSDEQIPGFAGTITPNFTVSKSFTKMFLAQTIQTDLDPFSIEGHDFEDPFWDTSIWGFPRMSRMVHKGTY